MGTYRNAAAGHDPCRRGSPCRVASEPRRTGRATLRRARAPAAGSAARLRRPADRRSAPSGSASQPGGGSQSLSQKATSSVPTPRQRLVACDGRAAAAFRAGPARRRGRGADRGDPLRVAGGVVDHRHGRLVTEGTSGSVRAHRADRAPGRSRSRRAGRSARPGRGWARPGIDQAAAQLRGRTSGRPSGAEVARPSCVLGPSAAAPAAVLRPRARWRTSARRGRARSGGLTGTTPPSTGITAPLTAAPSGPASHRIAAATSSGRISRPSGCWPANSCGSMS